MRDFRELQEVLGYKFKDLSLLREATTHSSAGLVNYERLEFLGDAILGAVIIAELTKRDLTLGQMNKAMVGLTNNDFLGRLSKAIGLTDYMLVARNSPVPSKTAADLLEALIGAVYQDSNSMAAARKTIKKLFGKHLTNHK